MLHKRHKLKVYATQEGIQAEPFSFKKIWDFAAFFLDPVRLGMQIAFGRVRRKTVPTGPGGPKLD